MIAIDKLASRLIADEGKVLHAYNDSEGFVTIGIGRLIDSRKGGGISDDECMYLFRNDVAKAQAQAEQAFEWFDTLSDERQGVIVCMCFQLGLDGVRKFQQMIEAIQRRDYDDAADEMLDSRWAKQTPARAQRMAGVMKTGVWE